MTKERGEGQEREPLYVVLTAEQEDRIARKAKEFLWQDFYTECGKVAFRAVLLVAGTVALLYLIALTATGKIKLPL